MRLLKIIGIILIAHNTAAQHWECEYVDYGSGIMEQSMSIEVNDSVTEFVFIDTINPEVMLKVLDRIPRHESVLSVDFGPVTIILTDTGDAIMFRKCQEIKEE